jgi:hypothetical protein
VLLAGARRIALIYAGLLGATAVVSGLLGLAAGSVLRGLAVGYYSVGAVLLLGCFVVGARGPLRGVSERGESVPVLGARRLRRATPDERSEASRTAILLFALGLGMIVLGSVLDPAHSAV